MAHIQHRRMGVAALWVVAAALGFVAVAATPASAQEAPTVNYVEGGLDFSHFTNDYGNGNGQWVAFILTQPANYSLRFDLSRAERWGDQGFGGGLLARKFIDRLTLGAGASSGSGEFIYPKYRVDASVGYGFLDEGNLQITLAYLHEQSKAKNSYDRMAVSANYYMNSHWIFGGYFNYDVGQPGDTVTKSIGLGATWYTWQKRYIGGLVSYGDVNYIQISDVDFLVAFENFSLSLYYSEYFNPTFGTNIRFDYGTNKYFDVYGISISLFKSW